MELGIHTMSDLFEQLGLPSDEASMTTFIATHRTTAVNFTLPDVAIWTPAQPSFCARPLLPMPTGPFRPSN